ncbi:hypothetical protein I553_1602 [Mycobacterium xenopi 4042]|uniref:Uncharacterized protein n=1 Tax=Mycobacterium xenopi 4042 TaxID=1299334 RepID=X8CGJ2_MYCXE|nr:hypothetical protein I553_1602 [Mycobacterium xenopi 4042]
MSPISAWVRYDHSGSCSVAPTHRTVTSGVRSGCWGPNSPRPRWRRRPPHRTSATAATRARPLSFRSCLNPSVAVPRRVVGYT